MAQPTAQEYLDLLKEADVESNRIALRVEELSNGVKPGMTDEEAASVKSGMQALVTELKSIGKVNPPPLGP